MRYARAALVVCGLLLCIVLPPARGAEPTATDVPPAESAEWKVEADYTQIPPGEKVVVAWGNVTVSYGDSVLQADRVVAWVARDQRQAYVEGNVRLLYGGHVARADRAFVSWADQKGIVFDFRVRASAPDRAMQWFVGADTVFQLGASELEARDATFTTSKFAAPRHYFKADYVKVTMDDKIVARNVVYYVRGVPVLYLPYVYKDLRRAWPWVRVQAGSSSRLGSYVQTQVGQSLGRHTDIGINFDYFSDRGVATGLELSYDWPGIEGTLESFWLPSDSGRDSNDLPLGQTGRWRYKFAHHQHAPEGWEFVAELQRYSDAGVRAEFFEDEAKEGKEVENRLYAKYAHDNFDFTALVKVRDNDFLDQTEYLPRVGMDLFGQPLFNALLLTVNTELAYVGRKFSELRTRPTENPFVLPLPRLLWQLNHENEANDLRLRQNAPLPYPAPLSAREASSNGRRTARVDTQLELSLPLKLASLMVEPFLLGRGTWYGRTLQDGADSWRGQGGGGVRLSTQLWRVYNVVKPRSDVFGLRHVITPELRVQALGAPSVRRTALYQMDEVDEPERESRVSLALVNRLQAKGRDQRRRDLLFFEVDLNAIDRDSGRRTSLFSNLRVSPRAGLHFFADADFTLDSQDLQYRPGLESANVGLGLDWQPQWTFFVGNRFFRDNSSRTTLELAGRLSDRYRGRLSAEYDWSNGRNSSYTVAIERRMDDFVFEVGYEYKRRNAESTLFANFRLVTGRAEPLARPFQRGVAEQRDFILR